MVDKVIRQCALDRDLSLFDAGDATEVGERGVTLRYVYALPRGAYRIDCCVQWWAKGNGVTHQ